MSDLKKQLEQINIPPSLHKRSLQGIEQAKKEQPKPRRWIPKILTVAVTLAAAGFIILAVGNWETQQQASSPITTSMYSSLLDWLCAVFLLLLIIFAVKNIIANGADKKLSLAIGVIGLLLLGNSVIFWHNQLPKPITVPLVHDFFNNTELYDLEICYITNKNDHHFVRYLQAGDVTLLAVLFESTPHPTNFYYPSDLSVEARYQFVRSAYFSATKEEVQAIIGSEEVFLVLDDGDKLPTTLFLDVDQPRQEVAYSFVSTGGGSNGETTRVGEMEQDVVFEALYIPPIIAKSIHLKEMKIDNKTYSDKDLPIAVKKGQRVTVTFQSTESAMDIKAIVGISSADGLLPVSIYRKASIDKLTVERGVSND